MFISTRASREIASQATVVIRVICKRLNIGSSLFQLSTGSIYDVRGYLGHVARALSRILIRECPPAKNSRHAIKGCRPAGNNNSPLRDVPSEGSEVWLYNKYFPYLPVSPVPGLSFFRGSSPVWHIQERNETKKHSPSSG